MTMALFNLNQLLIINLIETFYSDSLLDTIDFVFLLSQFGYV